MRKGRGLVDQDIFDEMLKIPGTARVLLPAVTNHRIVKGKVRVEIAEDAWPEVKEMVARWKQLTKATR